MKAIRIHEFGQSEDVLKYEDVAVPEPKAGEVLIEVEAASLNRADLGLRKGTYRIAADALPVTPGRELPERSPSSAPASANFASVSASSATRVSAATPNTPWRRSPKCGRCRMA